MKKRILTITAIASSCLAFAGCGNMAVLDPGNYSSTHIHTDTYHEPMCFTIEKWWDNSTGIEVKTPENGTLYFSEGDDILVENGHECPYCGGDFIMD